VVLLGGRQWHWNRAGVPSNDFWRIQAASRESDSGHGNWSGDLSARGRAQRWTDLGRVATGTRDDVLFHTSDEPCQQMSIAREGRRVISFCGEGFRSRPHFMHYSVRFRRHEKVKIVRCDVGSTPKAANPSSALGAGAHGLHEASVRTLAPEASTYRTAYLFKM
jgi:hypothetical protein